MVNHSKQIAIILPAYNEQETIAAVIKAFYAAIPSAKIIIVNNNSQDKTAEIAQETLISLNAHGCVLQENQQGKGFAVRRAFKDIDADIYVLCDADMTYPADQIHALIQPVLDNIADMVVGDRHSSGHYQKENKRKLHGFGNGLVNILVNKFFKADLKDIMSGYRAFTRRFVKNYPILVGGFQIETDMTLHALDKKFSIIELPIEYKDRPAGSTSKLRTFSDGARVIFTIFQILRYYRPLGFFSIFAVLFAIAGLTAGMIPIHDWLAYRYVSHIPLAMLAATLEICALLSIFVGLILDAIAHHQKLIFEKSLLNQPEIFLKVPEGRMGG